MAGLGTGPHPEGALYFCIGLETVGMLRFSPLMANRNLDKPNPPVACTRADEWDIRIYMPILYKFSGQWQTISCLVV